MLRTDILKEANTIITGDRQRQYGSAYDSFQKIANLWSEYLEQIITVQDVGNMMILLKIARSLGPEEKDDNYIDICGYAALTGEMTAQDKDQILEMNKIKEQIKRIFGETTNDICEEEKDE